MNLIYNEKSILNKFLENKECEIRTDKLIPILVKYYYINETKDKLLLREKILEDLITIDETNTRTVWSNKIDKTIKEFTKSLSKNSSNLEIIEVESINIYKEELEIIETIKEPRLKKILFVLLVWAKVYEKFNRTIIMENPRDILQLAKCQLKNKQYRDLIMHELKETNLVWCKKNNGTYNIRINYKKDEGEIAFVVNDFENSIYQYLNYLGGNWKQCECGKYFKYLKSKPKQKYCTNCSKEMERVKTKERVKKLRNNSKCNGNPLKNYPLKTQ